MPYVVTEKCIRCKYMDCIATCPVKCFYEGDNMLVIHPDECIDCATCEAACPIQAIVPDYDQNSKKWSGLNREYSAIWPNIRNKGVAPTDAKAWENVPNKIDFFNPKPGTNCRNKQEKEEV